MNSNSDENNGTETEYTGPRKSWKSGLKKAMCLIHPNASVAASKPGSLATALPTLPILCKTGYF